MPRATRKPPVPESNFAAGPSIHMEGTWVWAPLKRDWLQASPEELVRQRLILELSVKYGYSLDQMAQERRIRDGRRSVRADILICRDAEAMRDNRDYVLVVECKAESVPLMIDDFWQGEGYARNVQCEFLVMHNERETKCLRLTPGAPGRRHEVERIPSASDWLSQEALDGLRVATKAFTRDEFRRLLADCHAILRDNHKMDPGAAFDEISKILFIKMSVERTGLRSRFTTDYLAQYEAIRRGRESEVVADLFDDAKRVFRADDLFAADDQLNVSLATFKRIVNRLAPFDLSSTSDDVKGIAFESFLGQTFRGELGQFFTPRPVVEFMVEMLDPTTEDLICDPASGTGGFLIKAFQHVRDSIIYEAEKAKREAELELERVAAAEGWSPEDLSEKIEAAFEVINKDLAPDEPSSRMYRLSRQQIFGTDAEARAARVSKMNMIMHGDGHGGIYYHDGLLDIGGVLPGRFTKILTNPPFGSNVGQDQIVGATDQTRVSVRRDLQEAYEQEFGTAWRTSYESLQQSARDRLPILTLFDIGRDPVGGPIATSAVRPNRSTETLFLERCLDLLAPGGELAIVLPEGILNNPSMQWLRDYVESRARLLAVVSLPHEVFASSKATVKTSLVFLSRFTDEEETEWQRALEEGRTSAESWLNYETERLTTATESKITNLLETAAVRDILQVVRNLDEHMARKQSVRSQRFSSRRALTTEDKATLRLMEREFLKADEDNKVDAVPALVDRAMASSASLGEALKAAIELVAYENELTSLENRARRHAEELGNSFEVIRAAVDEEARALEELRKREFDVAMSHARDLFSYPVFVAEVEHAGITATGETGPGVPNQLPRVAEAYRSFLRGDDISGFELSA
jgi:type I restriction enzyme M protein